jgi:hypothetical protein
MSESVVHSETISDIQNYLQSFNKEIGESGENETAFYAIDTQKLAQGIDDGTLQMLAEQAAQGGQGSQTVANSDQTGYQTVAIVPDGDSGGYVLIVQQPQQPNDANQSSISPQTTNTNANNSTNTNANKTSKQMQTRLKKIKQEKKELERQNDISVYDFDEMNPPTVPEQEDVLEDVEGGDESMAQDEEVDDTDIDVKPNVSSVQKTPKRQKKSAANATPKKTKLSTPTSASNSNQHMCNYCNYTSNKRYLLSRHMKSHSEERPHKCGICERGFKVSFIFYSIRLIFYSVLHNNLSLKL